MEQFVAKCCILIPDSLIMQLYIASAINSGSQQQHLQEIYLSFSVEITI